MARNLIIYFSRGGGNYVDGSVKIISKGNTEYVAEFIQKAVGGDLFKIETVNPYPINYRDCAETALREKNSGARPELKKYINSVNEYNNIFICGPCWWGTYPMPVFSLIEKLDFTGKKIMPVITHEGSGFGQSTDDLRRICINAVFGRGFEVTGSIAPLSEIMVSKWAESQAEKDLSERKEKNSGRSI